MRLIERIKRLECRKPEIDYIEEARKFVQWVSDNNRMASGKG